MRISEVTGSEIQGTADELLNAVKTVLGFYIADESNDADIPTDEVKADVEAQLGIPVNVDTLLKAVEQSGFASSQSKSTIRAQGDLDQDINTDAEQTVDISKMAGNQAMKDIKADL